MLLPLLSLLLVPFLANAENKTAVLSFSMDAGSNCESLVKTVDELNRDLNSFKIDKQIQVLRCFKTKGILHSGFSTEITWTGGFNRCDGTAVGSDFYKFLQLTDDNLIKKIILEKLGFVPISIKNYSYNYMITLCQLYLDE
jgi:hypothetical protein